MLVELNNEHAKINKNGTNYVFRRKFCRDIKSFVPTPRNLAM